MTVRTAASVTKGDALPPRTLHIERATLVRYAGASLDFNPIHWDGDFAREVGLPDVIAHGMFTMAEAARVLTDFAGDPSRVVEYGVRFTRPVVVPDDDKGATVDVSAVITEKREDGNVVVELTARSADVDVLGKARGVIRLRD